MCAACAHVYVCDAGSHQRFTVSNKQKVRSQFCIRHYAGDVVYATDGWCEKNKDALHVEVSARAHVSPVPM